MPADNEKSCELLCTVQSFEFHPAERRSVMSKRQYDFNLQRLAASQTKTDDVAKETIATTKIKSINTTRDIQRP